MNKPLYLATLFAVAIVLRLIFFSSQVWLGSDVTRDISISLEAISRNELPLTGSFSSAGPFVFGPTLYWTYMMGFLIYPFSFLTPWYATFVTALLCVLIFYFLGKRLDNNLFFVISIVMVVFSPQLILSAAAPTQHTYVLIFTLIAISLLYSFYKTRRLQLAFFSGLAIGIAINMHYQALNLVLLPLLVFGLTELRLAERFKALAIVAAGVIVALLPLTYWDAGQQFANWRNMFDYLLIGQGRIYVPNSWRLYALDYLPKYFSYVTGLPTILSFTVLIIGPVLIAYDVIKRRTFTFIVLLNFVLLALLFLGRYYRGERFFGYTVYLIPLIIFFSAWSISRTLGLFPNKFSQIKIVIVTLIIASVIFTTYGQIKDQAKPNQSFPTVMQITQHLVEQYPGQKFRVLNWQGTNPDASFALATYLEHEVLYSSNGIKIGFCEGGCDNQAIQKVGSFLGTDYFILSDHQINDNWQGVSRSEIYDSTIGWLNKRQLTATFKPGDFIREKLSGN